LLTRPVSRKARGIARHAHDYARFASNPETGNRPNLGSDEDTNGRKRLSLATRSDLTIEEQVAASGATWLDRQLVAPEPLTIGGGLGAEVRDAMDRRVDHLVEQGLAPRQGQSIAFARDLLNTLRQMSSTARSQSCRRKRGLRMSPPRRVNASPASTGSASPSPLAGSR